MITATSILEFVLPISVSMNQILLIHAKEKYSGFDLFLFNR